MIVHSGIETEECNAKHRLRNLGCDYVLVPLSLNGESHL